MTKRDPITEVELRIEQEAVEFKRRRLAEELQKLADQVPALSPPQRPGPALDPAPPPEAGDDGRRGRP